MKAMGIEYWHHHSLSIPEPGVKPWERAQDPERLFSLVEGLLHELFKRHGGAETTR